MQGPPDFWKLPYGTYLGRTWIPMSLLCDPCMYHVGRYLDPLSVCDSIKELLNYLGSKVTCNLYPTFLVGYQDTDRHECTLTSLSLLVYAPSNQHGTQTRPFPDHFPLLLASFQIPVGRVMTWAEIREIRACSSKHRQRQPGRGRGSPRGS